jgi:hypothetical protein
MDFVKEKLMLLEKDFESFFIVSFFDVISSDGHRPSITQKFKIKIREGRNKGRGRYAWMSFHQIQSKTCVASEQHRKQLQHQMQRWGHHMISNIRHWSNNCSA